MLISKSSVDRDSMFDYMRFLLSATMVKDFEYSANFKRKITDWYEGSTEFINRFHLPTEPYSEVHVFLLKGTDVRKSVEFDSSLRQMFADIHAKKAEMNEELDLRKEDLSFISDCRLLYLSNSAAAKKRLTVNVSRFRDVDFNTMFSDDEDVIGFANDINELRDIVEAYTGSDKHDLTLPQNVLDQWKKDAKASGEKSKDHVRYNELNTKLRKAFLQQRRLLIRQYGGADHMMRVDDLDDKIKDMGLKSFLPEGFIGYIDDQENYYTLDKELLEPGKKPKGIVTMNPSFKDNPTTYYCKYQAPGGTAINRTYLAKQRTHKIQKAYAATRKVSSDIETYRRKWQHDMMDSRHPATSIIATVVELAFTTSARISNEKAVSAGQRTFGLTTLKVRHIKEKGPNLVIAYIAGKKSGLQRHIITPDSMELRRLIENIKAMLVDKDPEDYVFSHPTTGKVPLSSTLNRYLREKLGMPEGFSMHKFRKLNGTALAREVLSNSPFDISDNLKDSDVNKWVKEELKKVGELLGHVSNGKVASGTAIGNYIEPYILEEFFNKLNVRPDPKIQQIIDLAKS